MQSISAFKLALFSWHANDRVYVEFREQPSLDGYLGIIHAEQETILQDDCRTTVSLQTIHDNRHSQPFRYSPNRTENDSSPQLFPNRRMEDSSKLQIPGHLPYNQAHLAGTYYHGIHMEHPNHTATLLSHNFPHFLYYILTDLRGGQSWAKHMCLSESPYSTIFTDPYMPASLPKVAKAKRASSEAWKASSTKCFLMFSSRISPALDTPPPIT